MSPLLSAHPNCFATRRALILPSPMPPADSNQPGFSDLNYELPTTDYRLSPLSPLLATLTNCPPPKSFRCHSYAKHRGVGGVATKLTPGAHPSSTPSAVDRTAPRPSVSEKPLPNLNPSYYLQTRAHRVLRIENLQLLTENSPHPQSQFDRCGWLGTAGHSNVAPPTWLLKGA